MASQMLSLARLDGFPKGVKTDKEFQQGRVQPTSAKSSQRHERKALRGLSVQKLCASSGLKKTVLRSTPRINNGGQKATGHSSAVLVTKSRALPAAVLVAENSSETPPSKRPKIVADNVEGQEDERCIIDSQPGAGLAKNEDDVNGLDEDDLVNSLDLSELSFTSTSEPGRLPTNTTFSGRPECVLLGWCLTS